MKAILLISGALAIGCIESNTTVKKEVKPSKNKTQIDKVYISKDIFYTY